MDIIEFYRSVAKTGSLEADDDGFVYAVLGDQKEPKMVDGKRVVLPTKNQLANPNWDDRIALHLMSENILRGESPMLEAIRKAYNIRLNLVVSILTYELLTLAASPAKHSKLNPDQSMFLTRVSVASDKDVDFLKKLLKEMPISQTKNSFVSLYLKRGGTVKGQRHARVGVVNFPLMTELLGDDPKVFGIKPSSAKVRENLAQVLDFIIPNQSEAEYYYRGSDSSDAPYFEALLLSMMAVASPINDVIELFRDQLEDADSLLIESEWVEALPNFASFARRIPSLKGNEGTALKTGEVVEAAPTPAPAPVAAHAPGLQIPGINVPVVGNNWPVVPAAVYQPPAPAYQAPVNQGGGISFADLQRSNPALGHYPQHQQQHYGHQQQQPHNGVMPGSGTAVGGTNWNQQYAQPQYGNGLVPNNQYGAGYRV